MPGGTGHAAGAGPQAKESGSDFRRRNPEAMFVTKDFPLDSGDTSSGTENWVPIWFWFSLFRGQDGDFFRRQRQLPSCHGPDCRGALFLCVCCMCVCVCVCDRHWGPTAEYTSGLLLGCGPRTPQPWSNLEPRLESWELGPMASCFPRRPRSPSKAQLCLFLPWPLWERMLRGGPRASPRRLAHLHSLGGQGVSEPAWSPETAREPSPRFSRTLYHKCVNTAHSDVPGPLTAA